MTSMSAHVREYEPPAEANLPFELVASIETGEVVRGGVRRELITHAGLFKSAQLTGDGNCIITNNADNCLRTFPLPDDINDSAFQDFPYLDPVTTHMSPEPVYTYAPAPWFTTTDATTNLLLYSTRDHPIRLLNTHLDTATSSYHLVNSRTEAYTCPHSLLFLEPEGGSGAGFLAGSDSQIAYFDLHRREPVQVLGTIPSKRKTIVGGGVGMKGIVSTMAVTPGQGRGMLAAGTYNRTIGLYSDAGRGEAVSTFSVARAWGEVEGGGITQVSWSICGRYLFAAERMSDHVLVFDIRVSGRCLGVLSGRKAHTQQKLGVDVSVDERGRQVLLAGGMDGVVRVWKDAHCVTGARKCDASLRAGEGGDAISSVLVRRGGLNEVITASGSRWRWAEEEGDDYASSSSESDNESVSTKWLSPRSSRPSTPLPPPTKHEYALKLWKLK